MALGIKNASSNAIFRLLLLVLSFKLRYPGLAHQHAGAFGAQVSVDGEAILIKGERQRSKTTRCVGKVERTAGVSFSFSVVTCMCVYRDDDHTAHVEGNMISADLSMKKKGGN